MYTWEKGLGTPESKKPTEPHKVRQARTGKPAENKGFEGADMSDKDYLATIAAVNDGGINPNKEQ